MIVIPARLKSKLFNINLILSCACALSATALIPALWLSYPSADDALLLPALLVGSIAISWVWTYAWMPFVFNCWEKNKSLALVVRHKTKFSVIFESFLLIYTTSLLIFVLLARRSVLTTGTLTSFFLVK
jgi:hypothetical protein